MTPNSIYTSIGKIVLAMFLCLFILPPVVMATDGFSIFIPVQAQSVTQMLRDENAGPDRYKIVYEKELGWLNENYRSGESNKRPPPYVTRSDFIRQVNALTKSGYRLRHVSWMWNTMGVIGIVERSSKSYQYVWFPTGSQFWFTKGGFQENYEYSARKGFRLIQPIELINLCTTSGEDLTPDCRSEDIFVLERELEDTRPKDFRMLYQRPTWRSKTLEANINSQLQQYWREGFLPKYIFSKNELFLERKMSTEQISPELGEIQYITGGKWKKRINELAQQGYRLLCVPHGINYEAAVMVRKKGETTPTTYAFLNTASKSFDTELAEQERNKGIYRMRAFDRLPIFEQPRINELKSVEYKILPFRLQTSLSDAERKTYFILDKESQEREKELNSLVREGFRVLDTITISDWKEKDPDKREKHSVLLGRFS
jgi:hypothetical protein